MKSLQESLFDDNITKDIVISELFEITNIFIRSDVRDWIDENFQYNILFKNREKFELHNYPKDIDKNSLALQTILSYIDSIPVSLFWDGTEFYRKNLYDKLETIKKYKRQPNIPNFFVEGVHPIFDQKRRNSRIKKLSGFDVQFMVIDKEKFKESFGGREIIIKYKLK
jgi:hypothetical protein